MRSGRGTLPGLLQKVMGLNTQPLRDEVGIGTAASGDGRGMKPASSWNCLWSKIRLERGNQKVGWIHVGSQLHRLGNRAIMPGVRVGGDVHRMLATRCFAQVRNSTAVRGLAVPSRRVVLTATLVLHNSAHHRAGEYRLRLQRTNGHYQQQQGPGE